MRLLRATLALALLASLTGCGFVHFGRLPETRASDATLNTAYTNLSTEHKILKQELVLSRKEGDALRSALENRGGPSSPELVARLNETTRELATLRASYAKLTESKSPSAAPAAALEEKLAVSLRNYTRLQEENTRLRTENERTRAENLALTAQVKTATAQNEQTQSALSQLNTELLAQKEARARAEQQTAATAAQLTAVLASRTAPPATLAAARDTTANGAATLAAPVSVTRAPARDAPPTAELRTTPARLKPILETPPVPAPRLHRVQANDTLEKIAQKYYGDPARWRTIYFANNAQLSGDRPLKPGMELEIPVD